MHILLIHQAFASLDEAGGTRHFELAAHLIQHGHQVTVIASPISYLSGQKTGQPQMEQPLAGLTIRRVSTYSVLHRSFVHRVISFFSFMVSSFFAGLSTRQVDLIWGTSPPIFQGISAWLLARLKGVPFLFEVRDLWPAFAIAVGVLKNPILIKASLWLERFLYRHADRLMVNSPGYIQHVRQKGAIKVDLIPNGADPTMFQPTHNGMQFRKAQNLEEKFIVLYAGAHGISNDLEVILRAASLLRDRNDIQFLLVGEGKEKPNLVRQAQEMGLQNLSFLPPVPKNEMAEIFAAADVCIAILKPLELYRTTYPNKVFDSMASGKPVILAIDGVIREVVESAQAGVFAPPGDANALAGCIAQMADHPQRAAQMGQSGRQYVIDHFNRNKLAKDLVELLESMVT